MSKLTDNWYECMQRVASDRVPYVALYYMHVEDDDNMNYFVKESCQN